MVGQDGYGIRCCRGCWEDSVGPRSADKHSTHRDQIQCNFSSNSLWRHGSRKRHGGVGLNLRHFTDGEHCTSLGRNTMMILRRGFAFSLPGAITAVIMTIRKLWWGYSWLSCCCDDLQYRCQNVSHITWKRSSTVVLCYLSTLWLLDDLCISLWVVFLLFSFSPSFLFSPLPLSLAVCENREEPWPRFQYLWWHQWPGEPLQTLRHGTTRPGLPTNHSLPGFTSELPWKLLLVTAVFRLSVCLSLCRAAVDLVNFESLWVCDLLLQTDGKLQFNWSLCLKA